MLWVGDTVKVGLNPVSESEMYLFVNENRPVNEFVAAAQPAECVRGTDRRAARAQLDETSLVVYRPIEGLLVPQPRYRGRVVLIGDAVHATTQHLAAGCGGSESRTPSCSPKSCRPRRVWTSHSRASKIAAGNAAEWWSAARLGEIEVGGRDKAEHMQITGESFAASTEPI